MRHQTLKLSTIIYTTASMHANFTKIGNNSARIYSAMPDLSGLQVSRYAHVRTVIYTIVRISLIDIHAQFQS